MANGYEAVKEELSRGGGGFFRPNEIAKGDSTEVVIVGATRYFEGEITAKYWKQPKHGGKPYLWRFLLKSGQTWDVHNSNTTKLLQGLYPNGSTTPIPARFRLTNVGAVIGKQPSMKVEYLGPAEPTGADATVG